MGRRRRAFEGTLHHSQPDHRQAAGQDTTMSYSAAFAHLVEAQYVTNSNAQPGLRPGDGVAGNGEKAGFRHRSGGAQLDHLAGPYKQHPLIADPLEDPPDRWSRRRRHGDDVPPRWRWSNALPLATEKVRWKSLCSMVAPRVPASFGLAHRILPSGLVIWAR